MTPHGPHMCPRCGARETHYTLTPPGEILPEIDMQTFFAAFEASLDDDLQCMACLSKSKRRAWRMAAGTLEDR